MAKIKCLICLQSVTSTQLYQVCAFLLNTFFLLPVKITLSFILCFERAADKGSYNLFFNDDFSVKMSFKKKKQCCFISCFLLKEQIGNTKKTNSVSRFFLSGPQPWFMKAGFPHFLLVVVFSLQSKKKKKSTLGRYASTFTHTYENKFQFVFLERWLVSIQKPQIRVTLFLFAKALLHFILHPGYWMQCACLLMRCDSSRLL